MLVGGSKVAAEGTALGADSDLGVYLRFSSLSLFVIKPKKV